MSLMKLFNKNYLLQNLKKSKTVLSIFVGLIPILNTIILIMFLKNNNGYILALSEISIISFIGIYILPIIISICLFNYVYKKKSVDFINSMPISRKSIFVTNTILGIILFGLMLIVNVILIKITSLIFNSIIPFSLLMDYFWYFLVVYIFSFSATNLAMTVSGNAVTQIVVTLLLFFLVPFVSAYVGELYTTGTTTDILLECTSDECLPDNYYCYGDLECNINKNLNKYAIDLTRQRGNNYTAPFGLLYDIFTYEFNIINVISVVKMIVLSIVYMVLGYILFVKRKMEVSETSFKNIHVHNLVKSLTLVPFAVIIYIIFKNEQITFMIFFIVISLIYYFIYDLITKKSIQHIRLCLVYFTITISIFMLIFSIADRDNQENVVVKYDDIKEVSLDISVFRGTSSKLYVDNKELKSLMIKSALTNRDYTYDLNYITTYFKMKNNYEYKISIPVDDDVYDEVIEILSEEKSYVDYYKNIDLDNVYAIKLGNKIYNKNEAKDYLGLIGNSLKELSLKELIELQDKYSGISDDFYIKLYTYENYDSREFFISGYINYDLLNSIVNANNALLKEEISSIIPSDYCLYYINSYLDEKYEIDYYVLRSAKNEIYNFILNNLDNEVDMRKEYIALKIVMDGDEYQFTTNNVEEVIEILKNKYDEVKDTDDYLDYTTPIEGIDYYD